MCSISSTSFSRWHDHLIDEGRIPDPGVHQVDVNLQGEPGVGVAQPLRYLLHVAAASNSSEAQVWRKVWNVTQGRPRLRLMA